jgi:uncharacterized protein (TIGR02001 family)
MKFSKKLSVLAVASALSIPALMVAAPAQAEMSATVTGSNMYLWRGVNLTESGAAISGSLDYSNANGLYAGVWTTTETDGHETDLYVGFAGDVSGIGYDISFWEYLYPEEGTDQGLGDTDASELVLGLSYADFGFGYYMATDSDADDDSYITLSYGMGPVDITYGFWSLENPGNEYSHITVGYAATDELSFGVSVASNDVDDSAAGAVETDPLFTVTYSKSFDL